MDFLAFSLIILSLYSSHVSGAVFTEFVYPNFTASNLKFVDSTGAFLASSDGAFKASMFNPGAQQIRFYLCIIHVSSHTVIWSANRDSPLSKSGSMVLTEDGISIIDDGGSSRWSTPPFESSVSALQLTETGNLVLLDRSNLTLWESFAYPSDTVVLGQRLRIGTVLSSSVSSDDLSTGAYTLALTESDAVLQWKNLTYSKLSMDTSVYVNSFSRVDFLYINESGLYLFDRDGSSVVAQLNLKPSEFRVAKINDSGHFSILSFSNATKQQDFAMPLDECRVPFVCGRIGLCSHGVSADSHVCNCPLGFRAATNNSSICAPVDSSYSLPPSCSSSNRVGNFSYLQLGDGVDYFSNDFTPPLNYGVDLSECQNLCSRDCSCFGVFYDNSSSSCYKVENALGSLMSRASSTRLGFVKAVVRSPPPSLEGFNNDQVGLPTAAAVLLPVSGVLVIFVVAILVWRHYRESEAKFVKTVDSDSMCSDDLEMEFSIPGLPLRFDYEVLERATENFKTKIGTGGFGTVYKGMLPDKTLVAVKRITNLGIRGKSDFCTEIAVIGSIHHLNLVKLRGYCAQRGQWLLVYEYMNRGSLDKTLFGVGPPLEWEERVGIALGAARGLAYLHSGCDRKIIHCDVKPENILLQDNFHAKLSDFGLAKLLSREESSLFTTMRGTRGYLAPEWLTSSAVSDKTDVYSFGMVLLEIVSGRKNCATRHRSRSHDEDTGSDGTSVFSLGHELAYFPLYALEMHEEGRYSELVDSRLAGRVTSEEVEKLVKVALCCVHEEPGLRPSMRSVVGMLEGKVPVGALRVEALNFLRFYGRRFVEASIAEENGGGLGEAMVFQDGNGSQFSNGSLSNAAFSFLSSQQISGPR